MKTSLRILVLPDADLEGHALRDVIALSTGREAPAELLVIAPALNSRLRHWLSDEDAARSAAGLRLAATLASLRAAGVEVDGYVADPSPLQAIEDVMHEFSANEIVIATHRERRPHWLMRNLTERARGRFSQPVLEIGAEPTPPQSMSETVAFREATPSAHRAGRTIAA
jgi:nucleotide-binding universal stress UspA family protein